MLNVGTRRQFDANSVYVHLSGVPQNLGSIAKSKCASVTQQVRFMYPPRTLKFDIARLGTVQLLGSEEIRLVPICSALRELLRDSTID